MKLKLNNSEVMAITSLLHATCNKYAGVMAANALEMEGMLYKALFEEMWIEFTKRSFATKKQYQIKLKPSWACAFHVEFSGIVDQSTYEGNLIQRICDKIHQQLQTTF